MNKTLKIFTIGTIMCTYSTITNAITYIPCSDDNVCSRPSNCSSYRSICQNNGNTCFQATCDVCNSGYTGKPNGTYGGNTIYICESCMKSCTACTTTAWKNCSTSSDCPYYGSTDLNEHLEFRRNGGTCTGNSCASNGTCTQPKYEYRCPAGYGADVTVHWYDKYVCAKCPNDTSGNPGTSAAGTKFYDDAFYEGCYIAEGATFSDNLGSGIYADDCPYEAD